MGRGVKIPLVGLRYTMDRGFDIPCVGGGQNTKGRESDMPWEGVYIYTMGTRSKHHGYGV